MDEKLIIGKNIALCRKKLKLTQLEFAEKLNYSDKAISKWECGESIPDVILLKQIADMAGVSLDFFFHETHEIEENQKHVNHKKAYHILISLVSVAFIWMVATLIYAIISMSIDIQLWAIFIYAIPISCIVLLVFNSIWGKPLINYIIISALIWSILICIYQLLSSFSINNIWLIFVLGGPAEIIVILWYNLKKAKMKNT